MIGFAGHMALHMGLVAVVAPLLAAWMAGGRLDPARRWPRSWPARAWWPLLASALEFLVVWGWHVPALHSLARGHGAVLLLEQASFLASGWLLWIAALGASGVGDRARTAAGALALLLTATHMALLGVLFANSTRVLYPHAGATAHAMQEQQLGGVLMLAIGGVAYLLGGLVLLRRLLRAQGRAAA